MRIPFLCAATILVWTAILAGTVTSTAQTVDRSWLQEDSWPDLAKRQPVQVTEGDEKLTKARKELYNACLIEFRDRYIYWLQGSGTLRDVCENADRLVASNAVLSTTPRKGINLQKEKLEFAERILTQAEKILAAKNTTLSQIDVRFARYFVRDAEVDLLQLSQTLPLQSDGQ